LTASGFALPPVGGRVSGLHDVVFMSSICAQLGTHSLADFDFR